jgi:hypothetical protein
VYDMYPWDESGPAPSAPAPAAPAPAAPARTRLPAPRDGRRPMAPAEPATRAVQFALDRRDNGGDAAGAASATGAASTTGAAGQPTPSPARQ